MNNHISRTSRERLVDGQCTISMAPSAALCDDQPSWAAAPDVADACRQARDVLTVLEQPATASAPGERHAHILAAMAATARCRALLRSIVHLVEAGRTDR